VGVFEQSTDGCCQLDETLFHGPPPVTAYPDQFVLVLWLTL
jgi:hypothetical protein